MAIEQAITGGLSLEGLGLELGSGAVLGFLTGLLAKKVTKLIALLVGGFMLFLKWLEGQGAIDVDWSAVTAGLVSVGSEAAETAPSLFDRLVTTLGLGASFTGGFFLGFKKG